MNRKELYLEIGLVDDDLIMEAGEARGAPKRYGSAWLRIGSLAACLCLICMGVWFGARRDVIVYHDLPAPMISKVAIPSDAEWVTMSHEEILAHYGLAELPDSLSDLVREENDLYSVYRKDGGIVYDLNTVRYTSADGTRSLTLSFSKTEMADCREDVKYARVDGVRLLLGVDGPVYWAETVEEDVCLRLVASGMGEAEFTALLREVIKALY